MQERRRGTLRCSLTTPLNVTPAAAAAATTTVAAAAAAVAAAGLSNSQKAAERKHKNFIDSDGLLSAEK